MSKGKIPHINIVTIGCGDSYKSYCTIYRDKWLILNCPLYISYTTLNNSLKYKRYKI